MPDARRQTGGSTAAERDLRADGSTPDGSTDTAIAAAAEPYVVKCGSSTEAQQWPSAEVPPGS